MKRRVISLFMAVVFILTVSVFSMSVAAATEPNIIIEDFEDYTGGKPASALWEHNVANLTSMTDAEGLYGTTLYHNKNSRLDFGFTDAVTSGKVYLGFDIKLENDTSGDFALTINKTGSTLNSASVAIGYYNSNTQGIKEIADGNWHTVELLMDVTAGSSYLVVDGVQKMGGVIENWTQGFQFVRFQETNQPFYLDNLRLIASEGDVFEMYAKDNGSDGASLDFTRTVKNIAELKPANVTVKEVMTGTTLTVTNVTPVGGSRLNIEFDETNAVGGAEYAVTVSGAEFVADTPVTLTAAFNTLGGDKVVTVLDDQINNFAGLGTENDWSVYTGGSASKYQQEATYTTMGTSTDEGMKITVPHWTDSEYKPAFTIKNEFDAPIEPKGVVTVEIKIYNDNMYEFYPILYGTNTDGETTTQVMTRLGGFNMTPGFIAYNNPEKTYAAKHWQTTDRLWLTSSTHDAWHTIVTELDFDNNTARYKYDGGDWCVVSNSSTFAIDNYNNITKNTFGGFEGVGIMSYSWLDEDSTNTGTSTAYGKTNSGTASYTVDYVKVTQTLPNPVISKVRFTDYEGNEVILSDKIDAEVDTVKVYFSTAVDTATLANAVTLTLADGTAPTVTYQSYDATSNCATYKLSDYLMGGKTYSMVIADTITDAEGNKITNAGTVTLNTNAGKLIIKDFGFDKDSLTGVEQNSTIKLSVDIINTKGDGKDAQLSFGVYNDKVMTDFNFADIDMTTAKATYDAELPITVKDLTDLTIKGFLWDSFETIRPLIDDCSLTNVAE